MNVQRFEMLLAQEINFRTPRGVAIKTVELLRSVNATEDSLVHIKVGSINYAVKITLKRGWIKLKFNSGVKLGLDQHFECMAPFWELRDTLQEYLWDLENTPERVEQKNKELEQQAKAYTEKLLNDFGPDITKLILQRAIEKNKKLRFE